MDYEFSIIVSIYNTEIYLDDCINSVINQNLDFKDNVQLILVDDGSSDGSLEIASKYQKLYPENIIVLSKENGGPGSARNLGLKYAQGKYLNFLDSDDQLAENALEEVKKFFEKNDINIIAIPLQYIGTKNVRHRLNDKFLKTQIIDVYKNYEFPQLSMASCFVKKDILGDLKFGEHINIGEGVVLINKLLINEGKYALLNTTEYLYMKRADKSSILNTTFLTKEFFLGKVKYFYKSLIEYSFEKKGYLPDFIKYTLIYDCKSYYNKASSEILNKEEFKEFRKDLKEVINYLDDELILNHKFIPDGIKSFLIYLKTDEFHIEADEKNHEVYLKTNNHIINNLHFHKIYFDIVEIRGNMLNFTTSYTSACDYDNLTLEAVKVKDGVEKVYQGKFFDYPTTKRYPKESIGLCWKYSYTLDFKIPFTKGETSKIYFRLIYHENGKKVVMNNLIEFMQYCLFSKVNNYLIKDSQMVIYSKKDNSFHLKPYSFCLMFKLEVISILKLIKDHNYDSITSIFWHIIFLLFYPSQRHKRIWIFQDRVDIADDNAKHLFIHALKQDDDIEKYFVISKDCDDFKIMKEIDDNIIPIDSFKNKFIYMFAEKIVSSHVNHMWLNPFHNPEHPYIRGFLTIQKCFLQHGVIKDDLSSWLRKFYQNLHLFLTSSDYERDSIMGDTYNYDAEVVQAFGLPRHDNLKFNQAKKEILFAPTWRKHLVNRIAFEKSDYYHRLNSFLNNERLLKAVKEHGYKIVFKPHYDLMPFLNLFTIQDEVTVNTYDSYQTIFNNSAVMITDYSSVFFDFSFLKKPVIYYHQGVDYHYDEGYFDYESMGFGDVIDNEEVLVDKVIEYMENDCVMEDKYKKRVDNFFKYTDQKNCKRVYDWLYTH